MQYITILGSTGSIGKSTLEVIRHNPHRYKVFALIAQQNVEELFKQCLEFKPLYVALSNEKRACELQKMIAHRSLNTEVLSGIDDICALSGDTRSDMVMAAVVGSAGLLPTITAVRAGKKILLANKESLVSAGSLFIAEAKKYHAQIIPVDSEHNAIFQSLPVDCQQNIGFCDLKGNGVKSIVLTGSGGPFLHRDLNSFASIRPEDALKHPNWSMGAKISIDSATMMNKGLEYIEARYLFNATEQEMEIIIHPESIIHSMVRYSDGSVLAELGNPDMKIPIGYAMSYPRRIPTGSSDLDFLQLHRLTFHKIDYNRYPNLKLAIDAFNLGSSSTTALNAANEVAVEAFLAGKISFNDIARINHAIVEESVNFHALSSIDDVMAIDSCARHKALERIRCS